MVALTAAEAHLEALRCLAIVPAYNEAGAICRVVEEIRAFDPSFDVVVVDDASTDDTAALALVRGRGRSY